MDFWKAAGSSAARFSSSSMDLISIRCLPGACCVGGALSCLNGKPHGRAAKPGACEGLRAETTGLSQWLCEKCLSGSSSCCGERGLERQRHVLARVAARVPRKRRSRWEGTKRWELDSAVLLRSPSQRLGFVRNELPFFQCYKLCLSKTETTLTA